MPGSCPASHTFLPFDRPFWRLQVAEFHRFLTLLYGFHVKQVTNLFNHPTDNGRIKFFNGLIPLSQTKAAKDTPMFLFMPNLTSDLRYSQFLCHRLPHHLFLWRPRLINRLFSKLFYLFRMA